MASELTNATNVIKVTKVKPEAGKVEVTVEVNGVAFGFSFKDKDFGF